MISIVNADIDLWLVDLIIINWFSESKIENKLEVFLIRNEEMKLNLLVTLQFTN